MNSALRPVSGCVRTTGCSDTVSRQSESSRTLTPLAKFNCSIRSKPIGAAAVGLAGVPKAGMAANEIGLAETRAAVPTVAGATVMNKSEADGRFVLYWGPLEEGDISVASSRRYLKIGGSTTIRLNVTHPSFQLKTVTVGTMVEGELKLLTTPIILTP